MPAGSEGREEACEEGKGLPRALQRLEHAEFQCRAGAASTLGWGWDRKPQAKPRG